MAGRGRSRKPWLAIGVFFVTAPWLLGAQGSGGGVGGDDRASLLANTPPAGAGGGGGCGEADSIICPNTVTRCACGYICPENECIPAPPNCQMDADCPSGSCEGGKCRCSPTEGLSQCNPKISDTHTYTCASEFCVQLPDQCTGEGTACGDDGVCRRSQCYERCISDLDCPEGLVCKHDLFCGPALVPDGAAPIYACSARGGHAEGAGAWLVALAAIAARIRARRRR